MRPRPENEDTSPACAERRFGVTSMTAPDRLQTRGSQRSVVTEGETGRVFDDWLEDPGDPLNPLHPFFWAEWVCPNCAEDGDASDLIDNNCPNCGAPVESIP